MPTNKKNNLLESENKSRAPVVVVLGHVDHGKSSLLEAIRRDFVITAKEAGGITQHIGAYEVEHENKSITFIDTPGHEAFSAMRSRGAKLADIAILVVAADEGVKSQTREAILHAKSAGIPLIVAINKIDKPEAMPHKVKTELAKEDVLVEDMGGKIPAVEVSAKTGQGIKELLDIILLVSEMENLTARFEGPAEGTVVEAYLDSKRGPTATLLVSNGLLKRGDIVATPSTLGKARILEDFQGKAISEAGPSKPAVILGFEDVPQVGEEFKVFENMELASKWHQKKEAKRRYEPVSEVIDPNKKIFNIIVKADVKGSLEAILSMLKNSPQENIVLHVVEAEVGEVTDGDVKLAKGAGAAIVAFRVKISPAAKRLAENQGVVIATFDVIYELLQKVRQLMSQSIEPEKIRRDVGKLKVLVVFMTEKNRQIIGGRVLEGEVRRGFNLEIIRQDEVVGQGKVLNLQENKKDIEKAQKGQEVGILFEGDTKIQEGDLLVFFVKEQQKIII